MAFNREIPFHYPFLASGGQDWGWQAQGPVSRIPDQHFGMGMLGEPPYRGMQGHGMIPYWMRPRRVPQAGVDESSSGTSEVTNTKDKFEVNLDVSHFTPEEIQVKTIDNHLLIEGKHEEKMDEHGFISRHFTRKYILPKDVDPESVVSQLSHDGILTVKAPKNALTAPPTRNIPVEIAASSSTK